LNDEDQNINCFHFRNFGCFRRIAGTVCRGAGTGATRTGIHTIGFAESGATGALVRNTSAIAGYTQASNTNVAATKSYTGGPITRSALNTPYDESKIRFNPNGGENH